VALWIAERSRWSTWSTRRGKSLTRRRGGIVEKVISISCGSKDLCYFLLEKVDEELSAQTTVIGEVRGDKLVFRIIGFEPDVERTIIRIRDIVNVYRAAKRSARSGVTAEELSKLAKKSVPLDVLAKILRVQSTYAEVKGNTIYADCDTETLVSIAREVGELLERIARMPIGINVKKFAVAVSYLTGLDPRHVVRKAMEMGILNEDMELSMQWDKAVDEFLERFGEAEETDEL